MIRVLAFLFAFNACFCASAAAGPGDSREGQTTEVEIGAPVSQVTQTGSVVGGRAGLPTIDDMTADRENPVRKIPL